MKSGIEDRNRMDTDVLEGFEPLGFQWIDSDCYEKNCTKLSTCFKAPLHPHTLGAAHCRHNVEGVSSEPLREGDGGYSTQSGGVVLIDQVGVGWVCTIVNGTGIPWLIECALHKHIAWISHVNIYSKDVKIYATCGGR